MKNLAYLNFLDRLQNTGVLGRLQIYLVASYVGIFSFAPESNIGRVFDSAGTFGDAVGAALLTSSFIGIADSAINDLMTDRYVVRFGLKYRHYLLMSVASCYGTAMYIAHFAPRGIWLQPLFAIEATMACAVALFDIRRRSKSYDPRHNLP